ncbi:MFS transporter [Paenibacillus humicus]|uniref:MFS transporter n=1 Tax=Paenibacillus humicus TaxID=412861 RepID=UPI0035A22739
MHGELTSRNPEMNRSVTLFFSFYFILFMGNALYSTFIPVYFQDKGFSASQIGTLLSIGPFIAVLAQPMWGSVSDKSRTKNRVLQILLIGSGVSMLLYPLSDSFVYLMILIGVFTLFQTSTGAIGDAITLEALGSQASSYGIIRLGGTLGFALMSIVFGSYAKSHVDSMFPVYAAVMLISLLLLLRYPTIGGHQFAGRRMRIWELFKNRKLVLYLGICFAVNVTLGYYYAFFPLYYKELGADNGLLGWSMVISALSEVPFLLLSSRLFSRFSISSILLVASGAAAVRWLLFGLIDNPLAILPVQALHGMIFIVVSVTMSVFINKEVPQELRASGQTLNALLNLGAARIIGSYAGGFASEAAGMQTVFLYCAIVTFVSLAVFAGIGLRNRAGSAEMHG